MAARRGHAIKALTLDLDDTLWPVWPAIERAEHELHAWLAQNASATAQRFDVAALRALREAVAAENPHWGHDFTRMRRESLVRALTLAGDDAALADAAFDIFFAARNRVELYADARPALEALARRWPIVALTNGNADLRSIGLADYFTATVSAREFGVGKPDARIFHEACRLLQAQPDEVLHIGDDWALDVAGAHGAGLRSAWVQREGDLAMPNGTARADCVVRDLNELVVWLEA
ncbi:MAG: HAD-IA family hydrolase [Pseudomonadota bacterium]